MDLERLRLLVAPSRCLPLCFAVDSPTNEMSESESLDISMDFNLDISLYQTRWNTIVICTIALTC